MLTVRAYLAMGLAALLFAAGVAADRFTPLVGANAQAARLAKSRDGWKDTADANALRAWAWKDRADQLARLRLQENGRAVDAVNATQAACDARVAAARKSSLAIHNLVTKETPRDPQGCSVRQLIDPRELRDALRPAGSAATAR